MLKILRHHFSITIKSQMLTKLISETTQPYGIFLLLVTFIFANYFGVSTSNTLVIIFAIHKIVAPLKTLTHTHNLLNNLVPSFDFIESINQSSQLSPQISGDVPFITFNHAVVAECYFIIQIMNQLFQTFLL